ncbi:MAG: zinc metalloprotease [Candidatus Melainabacteria bacterium]|nr:zinc metalloprotease [Candidatus Melainabacteria bacterium]
MKELQRNCTTVEYNQRLMQEDPVAAENLRQLDALSVKEEMFEAAAPTQIRRVVIPTVFHIVLKDPSAVNDDQIRSQFIVLNECFNRSNSDCTAAKAGVFFPLAGNVRITFEMASLAPNGSATTGVTRTTTTTDEFSSNDDAVKFTASGGIDCWDTSRYLNIWVCNLESSTLGYALHPMRRYPDRDGVVINYKTFGTRGSATPPFNGGKTTVHEVGHWLNLLHVWGESDGCSFDDHVADTPRQDRANFGKPTFPHISCNNGPHGDMFCNFMDYVDDDVMVMFSKGQVRRMRTAIFHARSSFIRTP